MPKQRNRSTRYYERHRVRARRRGPTPKAKRLSAQPSQLSVVLLRLVRVTAVILAIVGATVLLVDWIEDLPDRESFDLPFWIGIGLMSPLGLLLVYDDVVYDAIFSGDGDSGDVGEAGDLGGDGGGEGGG